MPCLLSGLWETELYNGTDYLKEMGILLLPFIASPYQRYGGGIAPTHAVVQRATLTITCGLSNYRSVQQLLYFRAGAVGHLVRYFKNEHGRADVVIGKGQAGK